MLLQAAPAQGFPTTTPEAWGSAPMAVHQGGQGATFLTTRHPQGPSSPGL